jgi:hypothetical protein
LIKKQEKSKEKKRRLGTIMKEDDSRMNIIEPRNRNRRDALRKPRKLAMKNLQKTVKEWVMFCT